MSFGTTTDELNKMVILCKDGEDTLTDKNTAESCINPISPVGVFGDTTDALNVNLHP